MPTLVATVGGSTSNSYATVAEGTAYLDERLNVSAWTDAVNAAQDDADRALIMATRRIDAEEFVGHPVLPLTGTSTTTTQALKWPRHGAENSAGWTYEPTVIPECVKHATIELALKYLNDGTSDSLANSGLEGFNNVSIGSIDVTPRHGYKATELPRYILDLLAPVLASKRGQVRLVRG